MWYIVLTASLIVFVCFYTDPILWALKKIAHFKYKLHVKRIIADVKKSRSGQNK